jgi:taurine--2-oxoglutarate transaminase
VDRIAELERQYVLRSWSVQSKNTYTNVVGGKGAFFWDDQGKKYLDFSAQLVNANVGHQDPRVIEAIKEQADKMCYVAPFYASEPRARLAQEVIEVCPPSMGKVFFTLGGAESNENAIKIARMYTGKMKVISRYRSYHGATYGAITLTGDPRRPPVEPGIPGVLKVFDHYCYRCSFGLRYPSCDVRCVESIREVIQYENPDTVAAVMVETVTGTNGIFVPPPEYLPRLREICDEFSVLLICDEVMSGFGRTGEWFAVDHWKIQPDIMTMAKGLTSGYVPLGAVVVSKDIAKGFEDRMFWCGLTYSGHSLACAAGLGNMRAYREDDMIGNAKRLGNLMDQELAAIMDRHPSVGDIRNIGLFGAIELVKDRETREPLAPWNGPDPGVMGAINKFLLEKGVYTYLRWNLLFLTPPLCITESELVEGLAIVDESLRIADEFAAKKG